MQKKPRFIQNILYMVSGGAAGSLFTLATIPFISRLFNPNDFGKAALFVTLAMLFGTVAPLRYERASILASDKGEASTLTLLALICTFVISIALLLLISVTYTFNWAPYQDDLGVWLLLLPLGFAIVGLNTTFEMFLLRQESFKKVAAADALDPILNSSTRLVLGSLFGSAVWPLISSIFIGFTIRLYIFWTSSIEQLKTSLSELTLHRITFLAKKYKDFPLVNAPAGLINRLSTDLPVLLFGSLFAPEIVGFYAMAMRLLQAPVIVCSNAVRKVFHQQAAESYRKNTSITPAFVKILALTAVSGALPFAAIFFWGQEIMTLLLGAAWSKAGQYCELLTPWIYSLWITIPCSVVIEVLRKQKVWLKIQVFHVVTRASVFLWAYTTNATPEETLVSFIYICLIGSAVALVTSYYFVIKHQKTLPPLPNQN